MPNTRKKHGAAFKAKVALAVVREGGTGAGCRAGMGYIRAVGLGTFVDPRIEGGRMNCSAKEVFVELVSTDGKDLLRYKPFAVHVAVIRGSFADAQGNISLDQEPTDLDIYAAALAAHNSCGATRSCAPAAEMIASGARGWLVAVNGM